MKILITGAAGFIGFYVARRFLSLGEEVVGIDNLNNYYDERLKLARLAQLGVHCQDFMYGKSYASVTESLFRFIKLDISDRVSLPELFAVERFDKVINLAAQAGVRYSLENPFAYVDSNIVGFVNILECCRHYPVRHIVYASSSSVYGGNKKVPFSEEDRVDEPVSLYAATKKSDELIAGCYSKLYNIPATGLRFFTVYGPWGRPDMAPFLFTRAILAGKPIKVFNNGDLMRDFTYIDDIVDGVIKVSESSPAMKLEGDRHKIYNIGCSNPVKLMDFIKILEKELGHSANMEMLPMQAGDVYQTYADTSQLERDFGYKPSVRLSEGVHRLVQWWNSDSNPIK